MPGKRKPFIFFLIAAWLMLSCQMFFFPEPARSAVIDVTDYGANGADGLDDAAAIQNAINAASPGDTVYFPAGNYIVNNSAPNGIKLKDGVTLLGEDGAALIMTVRDRWILDATNNTNVTIENLKFSGSVMKIYNTSYLTFKNNVVTGTQGNRPGMDWDPQHFGFFMEAGSHHLYFHDNDFYDNNELFIGWGVSHSEWIGNVFVNTHEPIHLFGSSLHNTYRNNKFENFSRIAIELQDIHTGAVIENNEFRYEKGNWGMFAISFAAPGTEYASIRNNIIVGGREWVWGAGIEVMGQPAVEGNIIIDWQHGFQMSTGYVPNNESGGTAIGGPIIRGNFVQNPNEYGIWKTHVNKQPGTIITGNFVENAKIAGILISQSGQSDFEISNNMIVRDAGYWTEQRALEGSPTVNYDSHTDGYHDYNGLEGRGYHGIASLNNPGMVIKENYVLQRAESAPGGFGFHGIHMEGTGFNGTEVRGNIVISEDAGLGTGIDWTTNGGLQSVTFVNNTFENLDTVIKPGSAGSYTAVGNVALNVTNMGQSGFASTSGNQPPKVEAGPEQTIDFSQTQTVNLNGMVQDDGPVSVTWSLMTVAGIGAQGGTVTFGDASAPSTTATFSKPGWYVLRLTADDGEYSPWDAVLIKVEGSCPGGCGGETDTEPPTPPANLTSSGHTDTTVDLSWDPSTDNVGVTGYNVYRDGVKVNSSPIPATSYQVTGLAPNTAYTFTVKALDAANNESAASNELVVTTAAPPGITVTYLSDLEWVSATAGFGTVNKDLSSSGNPLRLDGQTYAKGIGTHAHSDIVYHLNGAYNRFKADIGIDDYVDVSWGSVEFQVWADGVKIYDSGVMWTNTPKKHVDVDITGVHELKLTVTVGPDNNSADHADWADAKLISE